MKIVFMCLFCGFFFGSVHAQKKYTAAFQKYASHVQSAQLTPLGSSFVITSGYESFVSKMTHIYFSQELDGLEILGTESSLHTTKSGDEISKNINFLSIDLKRQSQNSTPSVTAFKGFKTAIHSLGYTSLKNLKITSEAKNAKNIEFGDEDMTFSMAKASLKWLRMPSEEIKLIWQFLIQEDQSGAGWTIIADAQTGNIIQILDWVQECTLSEASSPMVLFPQLEDHYRSKLGESINCSNCYEVIALPFESPYEAERQIVIDPAHPVASPRGWHYFVEGSTTTALTTSGNNVVAFDANDNYGYQPNGGEDFDFTGFDFGDEYSENNQYESASITNVFYLINKVHDILFVYGFNESAGNFQRTNFDLGGAGSDHVEAKVQKSPNKCNSSFGVGPDGTKGVMTTNICRGRDADYDATVIIHEYGHGIYGRLTGGPNSTLCLYNAERTVEGVADWYALMLTMKEEDTRNTPRHIGKFFFDQGPDGPGIREYPYSTDFAINPHTYDDIKSASIPHGVGSVWANMLWEMTWELMDSHGFNKDLTAFTGDINQDAGNIMALALVTEGMKLQPCEPGFVSARDAILRADLAIYQGRNHCLIWKAFAKRGLGVGASQGDEDTITDGIESYAEPSYYAYFTDDFLICYRDGIATNLSGGLPYGGVYSGPGVIDNGDGSTFNLDVAEAGQGEHVITYEVMDTDCSIASSNVANLTIYLDETAPQITCGNDVLIEMTTEALPLVPDYTRRVSTYDECDKNPVVSQLPPIGEVFSLGIQQVTLYSEDFSGNISECSFMVEVERVSIPQDILDASIEVSPNPSDGSLELFNDLLLDIDKVSFFDVRGRLIKTIPLTPKVAVYQLSLSELDAGLYFMTIHTSKELILKRIIKQ